MEKLFGTDGIRAVAGQPPLDYSSVYTLGKALVSLLKEEELEPRIIIGRDTRESGEWLEQALFLGINAGEGEPVAAGIIPTSAVSFLTKKHLFSAGIVISASHNAYQDNGIKIFSSKGIKISDAWERKLEKAMREAPPNVKRENIRITPQSSLEQDYMDFLKSRFFHVSLKRKIKVVLDCSNGASSFFASRVFSDLGFEVITIGNTPDGKNINDNCGSLYPQNLVRKVIESKADIGVAYDGDADRAIWVDEKGRILNGDHTLFVLSRFMKEKGRLKSDYVVATTMSNMGLEKAIEKLDLKLLRTQVGDKYVLEEMMKLKANLGGEQSGHTIFLDDCPTGDGILTSLKMLEVMATHNLPLSKLVEDLEEYPQILLNIPVGKKIDFDQFPEIMQAKQEIEERLGNSGRLNVRYSGTEPVARVMIEGQDKGEIEDCACQMASVIAKYLGN
ncbi:MAG: phosphoglucosamine mutase [Candidatus Aminicenantes bacterium]|nr:phosphoglucosamine mutase [Candidatus Aminicenantes bacterium]